jgi:hypothetical protein
METLVPMHPFYDISSFRQAWRRMFLLDKASPDPGRLDEATFESFCAWLDQAREMSGDDESADDSGRFRDHLAFTMPHQRIFLLENALIGLSPDVAIVGDILCIPYGAKMPYLIRALGDSRYELIGECFVAGGMVRMDGELMEFAGLTECSGSVSDGVSHERKQDFLGPTTDIFLV